MQEQAFGDRLARSYRLARAPSFTTRTFNDSFLAVTECIVDVDSHGLSDPVPTGDAFNVVLQLETPLVRDLWNDGRSIPTAMLSPGDITIHDLRRSVSFNLRSKCHTLQFYVPRAGLAAIAEGSQAASVDDLWLKPGLSRADRVVSRLGAVLLPAFSRPRQVNQLFIDSVTFAIGVHLARTFGGMVLPGVRRDGTLTPFQLRMARELMDANLDGHLRIQVLADACGLSVPVFSQAFYRSTGLMPHKWLLKRRLDLARDLMVRSNRSLAEIAVTCGFSDQSHLSRLFSAAFGISPGAWRRTASMLGERALQRPDA